MTIQYRKATSADAAVCAKILGDWFEATPFVPRIHTRAEDLAFLNWVIENQTVYVAENGSVVGFLAREAEEINLLYLDPEVRGQAIGKALIALAKEETSHLSLWTFQDNQSARRFYEREGFRPIAFTDGADNEEKTPDVKYEWRLS